MVISVATGTYAGDLLHPSGETSARLMLIAMMIGPAVRLWPGRRWLGWALRHRRPVGVAAFGYAALHLLFYLIETETLHYLLAEIGAPGIWTGWAAFFLMLLPALASNDKSMRLLRRWWKPVQRLLYLVVLLTVVHWALLIYEWGPALIHVAPLALLYVASLLKPYFRPNRKRMTI